MKTYLVAAGALVIGTSAFALQASAGVDAAQSAKLVSMAGSQQLKAAVLDVLADAAVAATMTASATSWEKGWVRPGGDPDLDLSVNPDKAGGGVAQAPVDEGVSAEASHAETGYTGMGGPLEEVDGAPAALAPQPVAQNYPPCRPGPGDDNCIQLYEPGVRAALASWTQPAGDLGDGQAASAMGGPYEPVDEGNAETAMNGDGALDTGLGETPGDEDVAAM